MKTPSLNSKPAKSARAPASHLPKGAAGEVRIIGGLYKRSTLSVPSQAGLRPTPNRVRETLFNWLGQDLGGLRCLDVFAGSGALGFEAASRGAVDVLLIELDAKLAANLQTNKTRLQVGAVRIQRGDGIHALRSLPASSFDVIFIDPPFDCEQYSEAISAAAGVLSSEGAIYLEAPEAWNDAKLQALGLRVVKQSRAGAVHFHLLQKIKA